MKIHWQIVQRSDEWKKIRCGVPTASCFHQLVCATMGRVWNCPSCGEQYTRRRKKCGECNTPLLEVANVRPSSQAEAYLDYLLDDWFYFQKYGQVRMDPEAAYSSIYMDRGVEKEDQARLYYEAMFECEVKQCGFVSADSGLVGCSPDGLVMDGERIARGVELKFPKPTTMIRYLRTGEVDQDYFCQLQGSMLICDVDEWDILAYGEDYPSVRITVHRDEQFIAGLQEHLLRFVEKMLDAREKLAEKYPSIVQPTLRQPPADTLGVSDEDVERILESQRQEAM